MKISVIVPVYNGENYLKKCIESVRNQSHQNWELILVDDGSKDKSPQILDSYTSDPRIRVFHQQNAGPGPARNYGICEATGEFVVFLDADDYLDPDYLALLSAHAVDKDLVFVDVWQVTPKGDLLAKEEMSVYQAWDKDRILRGQMTGKIPWGGVRKAVRRELLLQNKIQFTDHKIGEEALYSFRILKEASSIGFLVEKPVYYYVNHENSQSKTESEDPWGGVACVLRDYLKGQEWYEEFADTWNAFWVTAAVVSLDRITRMYRGKRRREESKKRVEGFLQEYDNAYGLDKEAMSLKAKIFVPFLRRGWYFPITWASRLRGLQLHFGKKG